MNSEGEDGENNRLTVDYSVVLANIMNNVDKSQNYYVSSGVVIGDYYNEVTCCVLEVMSNLFFSAARVCLGVPGDPDHQPDGGDRDHL